MTTAAPDTMRAILQAAYGSADQWSVGEIAVPDITDKEVLVRITAASAECSGCGGFQFRMLSNGDADSVRNVAQSGEAGRAVVVGFVALDLLFGHAK